MLRYPGFALVKYILLFAVLIALMIPCAGAVTDYGAGRPVTLIAVQMNVSLEIYQTADTFKQAVDQYMQMAAEHFGDGENLVVFPEDVGLGLIFLDHYALVSQMPSIFYAGGLMMMIYDSELQAIQTRYVCSPTRSLLIYRGDVIRKVYYNTFSQAAKKYKVTLVAGSAPIPGPQGTVYNTSYIFGPDGEMLGWQRKVHLIPLETEAGLDLSSGPLNQVHPVDTPAGLLGVAICYDAFFDDVVNKLVRQGAQILVQPTFNPQPWDEWQANDWKRGIWTDVQNHSSIVAGVNPMMVGGLWEIQCEGMSSVVSRSALDGYLAKASQYTGEEIVSATIYLRK